MPASIMLTFIFHRPFMQSLIDGNFRVLSTRTNFSEPTDKAQALARWSGDEARGQCGAVGRVRRPPLSPTYLARRWICSDGGPPSVGVGTVVLNSSPAIVKGRTCSVPS
jgi:hypothetical protein